MKNGTTNGHEGTRNFYDGVGDGSIFNCTVPSKPKSRLAQDTRLIQRGDMPTTLPLKAMTKVEKLRAMEELWTDLTKNEETFASPAWHLRELHETEARIAAGKEKFIDWETAKASLRRRAK